MKRKIIHSVCSLLFLFTSINLSAQHSITKECNLYRAKDIIVKQQVDFIDPGASGKNIKWDFSHLNIINDKYQLEYLLPNKTSKDTIVGLEHETFYYYKLSLDTVLFLGYVNRNTEMSYKKPEVLYIFPLKYNTDTLTTYFEGEGLYGQKINLFAIGQSKIIVDAYGEMTTPENEIKKVTRVLRIKDFTDIGIDSMKMKMLIYQWFTPGTRYPIFETVRSFTIRNDSSIENFSTSFYFSEINREQLPEDMENLKYLTHDGNNDVLINCKAYPNPVRNNLIITYELTNEAQVSFLLCDASGRPWKIVSKKPLIAGEQTQEINMSGFPVGNYVLYLSVDEKVFPMNIIKSN